LVNDFAMSTFPNRHVIVHIQGWANVNVSQLRPLGEMSQIIIFNSTPRYLIIKNPPERHAMKVQKRLENWGSLLSREPEAYLMGSAWIF